MADFLDLLLQKMDSIPNGQTFFVGAADALATAPLAELMPRFLPGSASLAAGLTGTSPAFSIAKAREAARLGAHAKLADRTAEIQHHLTPQRRDPRRTGRGRNRIQGDTMKFDGVLFFPVTPFTPEGTVDVDVLKEHISSRLPFGPGGVFPACGTGEFHALSIDEVRTVVTAAVEAVAG